METRTTAGVVVAALLVVGGAGLVLADGFFSPNGAAGDDSNISEFPTATETATPVNGGSTDSAGTTVSQPAFVFEVRQIESCGQTCRNVTSSVSNTGDENATDVTVYSRIFVGNSTAQDDLAWQGNERVGRLDSGETYTATKTVDLSYSDAFAIQQAGGWVTIQTTVESDQKTVTFTRRRNVT